MVWYYIQCSLVIYASFVIAYTFPAMLVFYIAMFIICYIATSSDCHFVLYIEVFNIIHISEYFLFDKYFKIEVFNHGIDQKRRGKRKQPIQNIHKYTIQSFDFNKQDKCLNTCAIKIHFPYLWISIPLIWFLVKFVHTVESAIVLMTRAKHIIPNHSNIESKNRHRHVFYIKKNTYLCKAEFQPITKNIVQTWILNTINY